MRYLAAISGITLVLATVWEAFETIVLPRRVERKVRITRYFYIATWVPWRWFGKKFAKSKSREYTLSLYGPFSLLCLFAIWGVAIIFGYALLYWGLYVSFHLPEHLANGLFASTYFSATTFITLGLGDVIPNNSTARLIAAIEAANGLGFVAVVIGYLPTLYQAFSRREVNISLLDSRAGSPPASAELIRRYAANGDLEDINELLKEWEIWAAELMESHISYPVLCYFRSQHTNQSWVAALTSVLDCCALVMSGVDSIPKWQAQMTFAMARHALVDITQVFARSPIALVEDRLTPEAFHKLQLKLEEVGVTLGCAPNSCDQLHKLRDMYEPYAKALCDYLEMQMPPWSRPETAKDNWTTSAWKVVH